jgi:hypothetical protein
MIRIYNRKVSMARTRIWWPHPTREMMIRSARKIGE